jgi:hypothetical protein
VYSGVDPGMLEHKIYKMETGMDSLEEGLSGRLVDFEVDVLVYSEVDFEGY